MAHEIIWEKEGVLVKLSGTVSYDEISGINDNLYGDKRYDKLKYQISDYTNVTEILLTAFEGTVIGHLDRSSARWNSAMIDAVVSQDPAFTPVVDAYFKSLEGTQWKCRLFDNLDDCYDWIHAELAG